MRVFPLSLAQIVERLDDDGAHHGSHGVGRQGPPFTAFDDDNALVIEMPLEVEAANVFRAHLKGG